MAKRVADHDGRILATFDVDLAVGMGDA